MRLIKWFLGLFSRSKKVTPESIAADTRKLNDAIDLSKRASRQLNERIIIGKNKIGPIFFNIYWRDQQKQERVVRLQKRGHKFFNIHGSKILALNKKNAWRKYYQIINQTL